MKRSFWIQLHLLLAAFFLPLMLMTPLSGTLYLLGFKGEQSVAEAFRVAGQFPSELQMDEQEAWVRARFAEQKLDFDFEYIRAGKGEWVFRPSSRVHYMAKQSEGEVIFSRLEPNLQKRLMEIHMGHGPQLMKKLQIGFGIALILTALSGLYLAWGIANYRARAAAAFGIGSVLILLCLI
ncbi:MAG TPA: PepSY domain-containing protein [Pseudobdellovibrionaceae bacterium]|nr:PepSY domain-containing protein [Pseudobdellovibrionaceae bacterium]